MGVSTSPDQLARKLQSLARDIGDPKVAVEATALHVKRVFETTAASAGVLGHRVARGRIGVRYTVAKRTGNAASAVIRYTGPAHLVNNPTKPHRIEPRRPRGVRTRRRRGASVLKIGGDYRAWANHPGTSGKRFFEKAKAISERSAPRVFAKSGLEAPLRRNF